MKLYYFTPSDIQVPRVDRQCIIRFCEALADNGVEVHVVAPKIRLLNVEHKHDDLYAAYGVKKNFKITLLPSPISQNEKKYFDAFVKLILFSIFSFFLLFRKNTKNTVVYYKSAMYSIPLFALRFLSNGKVKLAFEPHRRPQNAFQKYCLKKVDKIVANSHALAEDLKTKDGLNPNKIIGTHQGVNLNYINSIRISREESKKKLNLPKDKKLAVYTGKVYDGYEEVEYYVEAAKLLPDDVIMLVVGGRADHVERIRKRNQHIPNLRFISFVPPSKIFYYQFAADALLLYYPPGIDINDYRSPGKLFDYMASMSPMIVADYPVLDEILENKKNALIIPKTNPTALAETIVKLVNDKNLSQKLGEQAFEDVKNYTWDQRAKDIIQFIDE